MQLRRVIPVLVAVAIALGYWLALRYVEPASSNFGAPMWFSGIFPSLKSGTLTWLLLWRFIAVAVVSLPFAIALARALPAGAIFASIAIAFIVAVAMKGTLVIRLNYFDLALQLQVLLSFFEILVVLPGMGYVLRRLSSNNRFDRSRGSQLR
jgi:hypothetical protein